MSIIFQQQFFKELLRSEKRRTLILISIFLFGMLFQFVNTFFSNDYDNSSNEELTFNATWIFPVFILLFELAYLVYLNLKIRLKARQIPLLIRYLIVACEFILLGAIMISVAKQHPKYNVLH